MSSLQEFADLPLDERRMNELTEAYRQIRGEIARLKRADLDGVQPAVQFDPTEPYRRLGRRE